MSRDHLRARPVYITTNSFPVTSLPTKNYIQYNVFVPKVDIPRKRQELIQRMQVVVAPDVFSPRAVYDGSSVIYSPHNLRLPDGGNGSVGLEFSVSLTNTTPSTSGPPGSYQIKLTQTTGGVVTPTKVYFSPFFIRYFLRPNYSDVFDLIKNGQMNTRTTIATNLLQLLIRQSTNQDFTNNGRAYFSREAGLLSIGAGIELWNGFFHSVRPTMGRMLITVDTSVAAIYASGDLIDVCLKYLRSSDVRSLGMKQQDANFRALERHLKKVLINVKTTGTRTKTIRGLVPNGGRYKFTKDDRTVTIADHYREAHGIILKYPDAFGIRLTGPNAPFPVIVPAELCTIIAGQLYKKKIPDRLTSEMVRFSTSSPADRMKKIMNGVLGYDKSDFMIEAGMRVDRRPLTVKAKILETPAITFGHDNVKPQNGSWNVMRQTFSSPIPLHYWAVVNFCPELSLERCEQSMKQLAECCSKLGMDTRRPLTMTGGDGHAVRKALEHVFSTVTSNKPPGLNSRNFILLVILPQEAASIRASVKHWGDVSTGVMTQCLRINKIFKANDQYWNNVAFKVGYCCYLLNARLGGVNSHANMSPIMKEISLMPYMVMGADVAHPGPGVLKPSVASLVWSHDHHATGYAALTRIQRPRIEIIEGLKDMVKVALKHFGGKNRCGTERIIFFRDGVSEGEYHQIEQFEIPAINDAIDEVWAEVRAATKKPRLTFIVVGKRHHVVLFPSPQDRSTSDKTGNCPAGTVVDEGVTHPAVRDFYLQSHAAIKGTSRSSHYICLKDDNFGNDMIKLQELAFALCHVYAKATRSVSIPAPVYYADLACSRGAFHINPEDRAVQFADDSTTASGSQPFNMATWEAAFKPINPSTENQMYFL